MREEEMLPCPFCGKTPRLEITRFSDHTEYVIECSSGMKCPVYLHTHSFGDIDVVIKMWNKRA